VTAAGRRRAWTVARVVLSLAVLAALASRTDLTLVGRRLAAADPLLVGAGLLLLFARNVIQAWRWQLVLQAWDRRLPLGPLTRLVMIGGFFTLLLPTAAGGDLVRWALVSRGRLERTLAAQSVIADRLAGLCGLGLLTALAVPWAGDSVPGDGVRWTALALAPAAAFALAAVMWPGWLPAGWRVRLPLAGGRPGRLLAAIGASALLAHLGAVAAMVCLGRAVGDGTPAPVYAVVLPLVWLVSLLPVSLGGLGVREAGFVSLMTAAGMSRETALAAAGLWLATTLVQAAAGGALLAVERRAAIAQPARPPLPGDPGPLPEPSPEELSEPAPADYLYSRR